MPQSISHPKLGNIEFPDQMTDEQIVAAIRKLESEPTSEAPQFAATPYGIGAGMKPSPYLQETTEMALRYGVPAVAAMGTMGASIPIQMAAGLAAGVSGEAGARGAAGQGVLTPQGMGEVTKAGILGAIPLRAGAKVLETAATMGAGSALAEALGASVAGQEAEDRPLVAGSLAAAAGTGMGFAGKLAGKISTSAAQNAILQGYLRDVGVEKPALPQIISEYAPMANRQAAGNPALANQLASTESQITKQLFDLVGDVPSNSEIAAKMAPLAEAATRTEAALKQAKTEYANSTARLAALEAQPQQTAAYQEAYESAALSKLLAARKQAAATFAAQQNFGDAASIGAHANDLTRGVVDLDKAVKDVSSALYSKTGLDGASDIVSRSDLMAAAQRSLQDQATSPVGLAILNAIENIGKVDGVAPERLSWNQFKNLRDEMSSKWASLDENYVNRAEALAGNVYKDLGGTFREAVRRGMGDEKADAFDAAQRFWYEWSQTRSSNFTRPIFQAPRVIMDRAGRQEVVSGITESSLNGLAKGLLEGKAQALSNIDGAIRLVGQYSPEAANNIKATVGRAMRGALIDQYRNDPAGLVTALAEQVQKADVRPFIELTGFGNKDKLMELSKAMRSFKKEDLTPGVIEEALAASAPAMGLKTAVVMQEVKDAAAASVVGATQKATQKLEAARNRAIKAGISLNDLQNEYNQVLNNPIMSVFTGRGTYKFSEEAGKVGKGTISDFVMNLGPDAGQRFMGALRQKDPQIAELVSRKLLADELYKISGIERKAKDATSKVDLDKLRRLYRPSLPQDKERAKQLEKLVGDAFYSRFNRFFTSLEKALPTLKEANLVTRDTAAPILSTAAGAAQPVIQIPGVSALGASVLATRLGRILEKPYFDLLTYMATDPGFLSAAAKGENFAAAIKSLPVQRGYLYLSNKALATDMAEVDEESKRPRQ